MPKLIRGNEIVEDDWQLVADDGDLPSTGRVIVSLTRYLELKAQGTNALELAFVLAPDDEPEDLEAQVGDLNDLPMIALSFPAIADGRCLSTAVLLRTRLGYRGELRAVGDVQQDLLSYMQRCGIDAFAVRADRDIAEALRGLNTLSTHYQSSVADPTPLFRRRHG